MIFFITTTRNLMEEETSETSSDPGIEPGTARIKLTHMDVTYPN